MRVDVTITVDVAALKNLERVSERRIEAGLNRVVDKLLEETEKAQILAYTATDQPPLPPGSDYERTFQLKSASKTRRTGRILGDISGEWYVDPDRAPYGKYVLGLQSQQADIHRGRWKSVEQVIRELEQAAPGVVERELRSLA